MTPAEELKALTDTATYLARLKSYSAGILSNASLAAKVVDKLIADKKTPPTTGAILIG